jgi:hypothetical protein
MPSLFLLPTTTTTTSNALQQEMIKLHKLVVKDQEHAYEGPLTKQLFNDFDSLFELDDGARLQLSTLSGGQPIDVILVDCLM